MLVGACCVLFLLLLLCVPTVKLARGARRMFPRPRLSPMAEERLACEDRVDLRRRELVAAGFAPTGTYSIVTGEQPDQEEQSFASYFLSPDRTTEAHIFLTRVRTGVGDTAVLNSTCTAALRSFADDGRVFMTSNEAGSLSLFPETPGFSSRRVAGCMADVVREHVRHIEDAAADLRPLDPAPQAREDEIADRVFASWLAHGLIRREGDHYRNTWRLGLRAYTRWILVPWGGARTARRAGLLWCVTVVAALVAAPSALRLDEPLAHGVLCALFAALAAATTSICFPSPFGAAIACAVLALVLHGLGFTGGSPWVAAFFAGLITLHLRNGAENRREEALFHAAAPPGSRPPPPRS